MSNKTIINTTNATGLSSITTLTVPASSTDREIVIWDGISGRSIAGGHGVLISAAGDIEDVRTITILAGPSNPGTEQTIWIRAADGHLMRGAVDLEDVVGGPVSASSTDTALARWDGTDGTLIQDSTVLLSDTNRFAISGQTFLYADGTQRNFFAGRTPLATMIGANNTFVGVDSGMNIVNTSGSNNTALGTETLANLAGGSTNLVLGSGAGASYTSNESGNILLHSLGVAGDNVIRVGTTQTTCYLKGVYGVTPGGTSQTVVVDSNGQLGTTSGTAIASSEYSATVATTVPVGFSLTVTAYKVGKMVTVRISAAILALAGPEPLISMAGVLPAGYRPAASTKFPMLFVSNGVYDTGLVGSVEISAVGSIILVRDDDAAPSNFEGNAGFDHDICVTFITA